MAKIYDLAVKTGEYEKDGERKGRYENVGAMWESKNGGTPYITLKAAFNPAGVSRKDGSDSIFLSCFEPKDRNGGNYGNRDYGNSNHSNSAPAETYRKDDGSTWTRQPGGGWTKDEPPAGPQDMDMTGDIPF